MSGVLHPVGPEPARVYWVRRAVVVGLFLLVVAIVTALVVNTTGGQRPVSAEPVAPSSTVSPTAVLSTTASTVSGEATPSPTRTATLPRPSVLPTSAGKSGATTAPSPDVQLTACDPTQLRTTLTGKQRLKTKEATSFSVSVINGGPVSCRLSITPADFELTVFSGKDRIWSSADCSTAVKTITTGVASEKSVGWTMRWNGLRSAKDCKSGSAIPRAGTYVATAQLTGATQVQLRMVLS